MSRFSVPKDNKEITLNIGCVILAAGQSKRFGENKLLAPLAGVPVLEHTLRAIPRSLFSKVVAVVSTPKVAQLCRLCGVGVCSYPGGPQSQSVRLGVQSILPAHGCLFVMGDQPLCTQDSIRRMVSAFKNRPQQVYRLAYQGQVSSPTLFPKHVFPSLLQLSGECGGMAAVGDTPISYVQGSARQELLDADTPDALQELERYLLETS